MRDWLANHGFSIAVALAVGLGIGLWTQAQPASQAIEVQPREVEPTSVVPVYVHIDGAVLEPGVYELPTGARVFEAIEAAGGAADDADVRELNLAARLADGQKLVIPTHPPPEALENDSGSNVGVVQPTVAPAGGTATEPRININTATARILETLPGIGEVTARKIIDYRSANGPFTRIEQLQEARLVNAPTFERIKSLTSVE
ncbi:MAG: hypothetical protein GEU73_08345 [Chloroflexi bacterium]|nr:hypothetical protein [Chloroflexota bacterium]